MRFTARFLIERDDKFLNFRFPRALNCFVVQAAVLRLHRMAELGGDVEIIHLHYAASAFYWCCQLAK